MPSARRPLGGFAFQARLPPRNELILFHTHLFRGSRFSIIKGKRGVVPWPRSRLAEVRAMAEFLYEALDGGGKQIKGIIEAGNDEVILEKLRDMGYYPLKVMPHKRRSAGRV